MAGWEARIELTSMLFLMIYEVALADGGNYSKSKKNYSIDSVFFFITGAYVQNIKRTAQ